MFGRSPEWRQQTESTNRTQVTRINPYTVFNTVSLKSYYSIHQLTLSMVRLTYLKKHCVYKIQNDGYNINLTWFRPQTCFWLVYILM